MAHGFSNWTEIDSIAMLQMQEAVHVQCSLCVHVKESVHKIECALQQFGYKMMWPWVHDYIQLAKIQ